MSTVLLIFFQVFLVFLKNNLKVRKVYYIMLI
nr:MAG TPA: hypothetical protein [Caudoviricetes sp.]